MTDWKPQKGEMIEVSNFHTPDNWLRRVFLVYNETSNLPWVVRSEDNLTIIPYPNARPIQKEEGIQIWDVVRLPGTECDVNGIVIDVLSYEANIYIPSKNLITSFRLDALKKLPNKVAMAPASHIYQEMRVVGKTLYTKAQANLAGNGCKEWRWPHSIASLSIEDKI